jgi:hypothetical protein
VLLHCPGRSRKLGLADFASRLRRTLEVRREEVRERQTNSLEVQTEAGGLLVAMVGELRVSDAGTAAVSKERHVD